MTRSHNDRKGTRVGVGEVVVKNGWPCPRIDEGRIAVVGDSKLEFKGGGILSGDGVLAKLRNVRAFHP